MSVCLFVCLLLMYVCRLLLSFFHILSFVLVFNPTINKTSVILHQKQQLTTHELRISVFVRCVSLFVSFCCPVSGSIYKNFKIVSKSISIFYFSFFFVQKLCLFFNTDRISLLFVSNPAYAFMSVCLF